MTTQVVFFFVTLIVAVIAVDPKITQPPSASASGQCQHGGTMYCQCPFGYTGRYCETAINSCNNTHILSHNGDVTIQLCGPHGTCHYDPNSGSYCICNPGWTGAMCDQTNSGEVHISNRCALYYGSTIPNPNCTTGDRCLTDDLNCAFSQQLGCTNPSPGWCLPEKRVMLILASLPQHQRYF